METSDYNKSVERGEVKKLYYLLETKLSSLVFQLRNKKDRQWQVASPV
jgi:hypothetical protein